MRPPLQPLRARAWLRRLPLQRRTDLLLAHDDLGIQRLAARDGYRLTCPADIARERDAACPPLPLTDAT